MYSSFCLFLGKETKKEENNNPVAMAWLRASWGVGSAGGLESTQGERGPQERGPLHGELSLEKPENKIKVLNARNKRKELETIEGETS